MGANVLIFSARATLTKTLLIVLTALSYVGTVNAVDIHIAVASNFRPVMQKLVSIYELQSSNNVSISAGSTGKHYAQIINGAPFDLFFAADTERPRLIEENKLGIEGSRFTYALGKLVLWNPSSSIVNHSTLEFDNFKYLSIANPRLAPYGRAAEQAIQKLGLSEMLQPKLVKGENVSQAFQYIESGNADLGFVAYSHLLSHSLGDKDNFWLVPNNYYDNIEQQVIMLKDSEVGREFLMFITSPHAQQIISDAGYDLP